VPRTVWLALCVFSPCVAAGCVAIGEGVLPRRRDADAGKPPIVFFEGGTTGSDDAALPPTPPHSVRSVDPPHGSFAGGARVLVRGTGFGSDVRIWFGGSEVPHTDVVPLDPTRAQAVVPPGSPGFVEVSTQNGDDASTRTALENGYEYDPFYLSPSSGPVSGGTVVTVYGEGAVWDASTEVFIDGSPCAVLATRNPAGRPAELDCRTPPGTPGAKTVRVVANGASADVLEAFVYGTSDDGFRGGLSGSGLAGSLRVIVLNSLTGRALEGASVVLGSDPGPADVHVTGADGVAAVKDASLTSSVTVTIAARCFMPTTFVDVPVDTVTAYLDPVLSPDCLDNGQPTGVGQGGAGSPQTGATVKGQLVWSGGIEFKRAGWDVPLPADVPDAGGAVRQAAYVFPLATDPASTFRLPSAKAAVTPASDGDVGYAFTTTTGAGNLTLYALAGIEDRRTDPPRFTAYTMGIVSGVGTAAGSTVSDVYIPMNIPLDHALSLRVDGPTPTPRGPDRVGASVSIRYSNLGYVVLPISSKTALLPATSPFAFVGLPPLSLGLTGSEYVMTAKASTGESHSPPLSVLGLFATTAPSGPVDLSGFLEVPELVTPAQNGDWNGRDLQIQYAPGGPAEDLTTFEIDSGGGLSTWLVVVPRGRTSVRLPDLSPFGSVTQIVPGPVTLHVARATISNFDYGNLRYSNLGPSGWAAYAADVFQSHR
jgi:hypothetical protein